MYHGDIRLNDTIDVKFTTRAFSTGAPTTLAGSPSVAAYPGNSTTEITAGITLSVDFDSRTGLHNVRIVATSGNGYATATNYTLVITAGTVGGTSVVGECVGSFSIEARSALMPTTAARTLVVDANGLADANMVKMGPTGSGTTQTARDIGASVLLSSGSGAGQLDFTSGVVKANATQILGTALTESAGAGKLAGAFVKLFNVTTPTAQCDNLPLNTDYTAARAVKLDNLDATTSSRLAAASVPTNFSALAITAGGAVTVGTNGDKTGYSLTAAYDLAKTAAQAGDAMTLTAGERTSVADALLARNVAGGSSAGRLVKEALYVLRNKVDVQAGTLTVYGTDDTTAAFTAAVTTAAGNPISTIDPA